MWIYLIRHGETNGNRHRIVQTPETPLSEVGLKQAEQLALAYRNLSASVIISSDYERAQSTARPLHRHLNCKAITSEVLRERNFGDLRGRAYDDIEDNFFAESYSPPNGESYEDFKQRVKDAWQYIIDIAEQQNGNVIVVTHGLVLRCLFNEVLTVNGEGISASDIANTSVTKISKLNHTLIPMLCDISHLEDGSANNMLRGAV